MLLSLLQAAMESAPTAIMATSSLAAYDVEVLTGSQGEADPLAGSDGSGVGANHPYAARIAVIRELHSRKSDRSCLHVELDTTGSGVTYEAGDHVALFAQNGPAVVEEVGRRLGVPLETLITLRVPEGSTQGKLSAPFPGQHLPGEGWIGCGIVCGMGASSFWLPDGLMVLQLLRQHAGAGGPDIYALDFVYKRSGLFLSPAGSSVCGNLEGLQATADLLLDA